MHLLSFFWAAHGPFLWKPVFTPFQQQGSGVDSQEHSKRRAGWHGIPRKVPCSPCPMDGPIKVLVWIFFLCRINGELSRHHSDTGCHGSGTPGSFSSSYGESWNVKLPWHRKKHKWEPLTPDRGPWSWTVSLSCPLFTFAFFSVFLR